MIAESLTKTAGDRIVVSQPTQGPGWRAAAEAGFVHAVQWIVCRVSPGSAALIGRVLGRLFYLVVAQRRHVIMRNLRVAFGDGISAAEAHRLGIASVQNFFCTLVEFLRLPLLSTSDIERLVDFPHPERARDILAQGKGMIIVTPHIGNWEYMAARVVAAGFPLTVIARDPNNPPLAELMRSIRTGAGLKILPKISSMRGALQTLRANEILGILPDQHAGEGGVLVDFFGASTPMHSIPALLSMRTGAPVVIGGAFRQPDGRFLLDLQPPVDFVVTGQKQEDLVANTRRVVAAMEELIRTYPEQWLWMHKRWRAEDALSATE